MTFITHKVACIAAVSALGFTLGVPGAVAQTTNSATPAYSSSADSAAISDAPQNVQLAHLTTPAPLPVNAMQYGGGRSGRPRYRGGSTNADGSPRYDFYGGAGFGTPTGQTNNYFNTGYGFQFGGGRNFSKALAVNLEFDYDHFSINDATLNDYVYVNTGVPNDASAYQLGGNMHIWNFSIQPVLNLKSGEGFGAYVTGGVGFYHKVSNFTVPATSCGYYFCETSNQNIDHYTSNAPGFDGGFGVTYKFSRFSNERFFGEIRYVYINNQYRPGATDANYTTYSGYNYFPANSLTTSYFPVKFGLRF